MFKAINVEEPRYHCRQRRRFRDRAGKALPKAGFRSGSPYDCGQGVGVTPGEVEAIDVIGDALGHSPNIGTDDRAAKRPRLRYHEAKSLFPEGGRNAPVNACHSASQLIY